MLKGVMGLLQLFAEGAAVIACCCLLTGKEMSGIILCELYPSLCWKSNKCLKFPCVGFIPVSVESQRNV
jgi:hypothetical protein